MPAASVAALVRRPDWQPRLLTYCQALAERPFAYGSNDCFTFVSGAVDAMTGARLSPELEGTYRCRFGMLRQLVLRGHRSLYAAAAARAVELGWACVGEAQTQPGDIVLLPGVPLHSLAVRWEGGVLGQALDGLAFIPCGHALAAWHIPFEGEDHHVDAAFAG